MKKKRRTRRATYWGMAANTTSRDWGLGPVSGKGGATRNHEIQQSMIQREMREQRSEK